MNGYSRLSQGRNAVAVRHDLVTSSFTLKCELWAAGLWDGAKIIECFVAFFCAVYLFLACVCVYVHVLYSRVFTCVCVGMPAFVCPCEGQRSSWSIFLYCSSHFFFFWPGLSLNKKFIILVRLLDSKPLGSAVSTPPPSSVGVIGVHKQLLAFTWAPGFQFRSLCLCSK